MEGSSNNGNENIDGVSHGMVKLSLSGQNSSSQSRKSDRKEIYCPFTWEECNDKFDDINWVDHLNTKLSRVDSNDWRVYCYKLLLGCIYSHQKEEEEAIKTFESCEKQLEDKKNDNFFKEIMGGLWHILSSCKLHLNIKMGKNEAAREIFSSIKSYNDLNKESQAAVWAVKAYILREFGYEGKVEALKCAKLAIELDPDDCGIRRGAWYFLAGKIFAELRHVQAFNTMPSDEEKQLMERSVEKNPFPVHFVLLADVYREIAKVLLQRSFAENKSKSEELCEKSKKLYEDAVNQKNVSVSLLRRSGMGLIKLPKNFRNLELAKKAFETALSIDPGSSTASLGMGYLLEWHMNDYKEALKYFEQSYASGNHGAGVHVIKMKYKLNKTYNPLVDCDKYIENLRNMLKSRGKLELNVTYIMTKAEFLLVIKRDLLAAAHEWENAMDAFPSANNLWEYRCIFVIDKELSVYKIMVNEINQAVTQKKFNNTDEGYLKKILNRCKSSTNPVKTKDRS